MPTVSMSVLKNKVHYTSLFHFLFPLKGSQGLRASQVYDRGTGCRAAAGGGAEPPRASRGTG